MENNTKDNVLFPTGFFRIPSGKNTNDFLISLIKARLSSSEYQIILLVLRKTFGFNKIKDWISLTQFENFTSKTRSTICAAINQLVKKNILVKKSIKGLKASYQLNQNILEWQQLVRKIKPVRKTVVTSPKNHTLLVGKLIPTINTFTKNNISSKDEINTPAGVLVNNKVKRERKKCPLEEKHSLCITFLQELAKMKNLDSGWLNFPKQLGFLHKLLRAGYQLEDIKKIAQELDADKFMWDKWDLATIVSRIEKKGKEVIIHAGNKRNY